jgi:hypothetical protein
LRRRQPLSILFALLLTVGLSSALYGHEIRRISASTSESSLALNSLEQQVVGLVNGSKAYDCDLELEDIALSHPDFRSAGSIGANETANLIKEKFESFGLEAWLEPFEFTNWSLLDKPSLVIDEDGNQSTIGSFQCEHYSWPTPSYGVFADLVILPLPPAANFSEIGVNQINMTEWSVDTTGKIVLIGREIRWGYSPNNWQNTFVNKLTAQTPAAVVYTWWYPWMNFTPPLFSSAGGLPLSGFGTYYWNLHIPSGFVNYEDGLWIRDAKSAHATVSANVSVRAVIGNGTQYNVVGKIAGYQNPENIVIISGHYDSVMDAGFCDNGAGIAGVIELARVFADAINKSYYQPKYTLWFVGFTGEELDLVGSANFVKQHKNDMANITAVINLDCIGSDNLYVTETPGSDLNLNQMIMKAAQDLGINITSEKVGGSDQESFRVPGIVDSDINYFWGVDLGISDATPVDSSAMLDSYPLFYNDLWNMGAPGWIHTAYDNSTTLDWVEVGDFENHIKVAALSIMRVSPNVIPEFPSVTVIALLLVITLLICVLTRTRSRLRTQDPNHLGSVGPESSSPTMQI